MRRITLLDRRHGVPEEEGLELQPRSCEGRDPLLQADVGLPVRKRPLLGVDAMRLEERDYVPDGLWGLVEGLQVRNVNVVAPDLNWSRRCVGMSRQVQFDSTRQKLGAVAFLGSVRQQTSRRPSHMLGRKKSSEVVWSVSITKLQSGWSLAAATKTEESMICISWSMPPT